MKKLMGVLTAYVLMSGLSYATDLHLERGWNLKGSPCYVNVENIFNYPGKIITVWKWQHRKWQVWSPDPNLMEVIEKYSQLGAFDILYDIEPYDGFWVNTNATMDVNLCNIPTEPTPPSNGMDEDLRKYILKGLPKFLANVDGKQVTIFEDKQISCKVRVVGNSTISVYDCSDPEYDGNGTINWKDLTINNEDQIILADENTLCVGYEEDGIYRTGCMVINVPDTTDEEIASSITQGSRVPFYFNSAIGDWEPSGFCLTYYDNGTVVSTAPDGSVLGTCNYEIKDGNVVTTCNTDKGIVKRVGKSISPFVDAENNVTGAVINVRFYLNDTIKGYNNLISIRVENCEDFWKEYESEDTENPQDFSDIIAGRVIIDNGTTPDLENIKIRLTPDVEQVHGDWGGIVCQINPDGSFGDRCVLHGDLRDFTTEHRYQVIIFYDANNNWHFDKGENTVIYGEENATFDDLKSIIIDLNFSTR